MEITEELMEQTYQFCYKRLSNPDDARDLAQDILCEALQAISGGRKIMCFQSWFWKMARNRYAVMINRRNQKPTVFSMEDYMEELVSETEDLAEQIVLEEELSRMHAVIARLSEIHREILIQYYLKGQSIQKIAALLEVPEGTVKRRLFDAKQEARKGMKTMPRVTELSYAPMELELWMSPEMQGKEVFLDLMGKQVLAACYENPRTVQELSEEMQIAPCYLEDKIWRMEETGVIGRVGKKYQTSFIIFSKNRITDMLQDMESIYMSMCETAYHAVKDHWTEIRDIGFYGANFTEKYLNMIFLYMAIEQLGIYCMEEYHKTGRWKEYFAKEDDCFGLQAQRIMGSVLMADEIPTEYERKALDWQWYANRIETVSGKAFMVQDCFCAAPFPRERIFGLHGNNVELLYQLSKEPDKELSYQEQVLLSGLIENGFVTIQKEGYYPDIVIMEKEQWKFLRKWFYDKLHPAAKEYAEQLSEKLNQYLLPKVRKDLLEQYYNYVVNIFLIPASSMMWWCKEQGLYDFSENPKKSKAGIFMIVH